MLVCIVPYFTLKNSIFQRLRQTLASERQIGGKKEGLKRKKIKIALGGLRNGQPATANVPRGQSSDYS